jgi:hypothetical protein
LDTSQLLAIPTESFPDFLHFLQVGPLCLETYWNLNKINVIFVDVQQVDKYFKYTEISYEFSEQRDPSKRLIGRSASQHISSVKLFISINFNMITCNKIYQMNVNLTRIIQYHIFSQPNFCCVFKKHLTKKMICIWHKERSIYVIEISAVFKRFVMSRILNKIQISLNIIYDYVLCDCTAISLQY